MHVSLATKCQNYRSTLFYILPSPIRWRLSCCVKISASTKYHNAGALLSMHWKRFNISAEWRNVIPAKQHVFVWTYRGSHHIFMCQHSTWRCLHRNLTNRCVNKVEIGWSRVHGGIFSPVYLFTTFNLKRSFPANHNRSLYKIKVTWKKWNI